jgi:hypothetical protein
MLPRQARHLQSLQQPADLETEQVADRTWFAEVDQRRVNAVLERRLVLDEVQTEAGELALLADARIGQPDRRHQVAVGEQRKNLRVDLVGLACQRRETLDLLGVGDLDRQALLLESVVDGPCAGHAQTCWPWSSSMRQASLLSESTSGATASWSRCSPRFESRQTSSFLRLRSSPACNIGRRPPRCLFFGTRQACHRTTPFFMAVQLRRHARRRGSRPLSARSAEGGDALEMLVPEAAQDWATITACRARATTRCWITPCAIATYWP